jgi:VCBS repeat-containing protein
VIATATATGVATEWADKSTKETANTPHTATGAVTYTDANALDTHTASFVARGTDYLGTFSLNTTAIDSGDKVTWSFSVSDSAIDYLNAGQTLTQLYDVTIDDGHGGTVVQTITITLNGAADGAARTTRKARGSGSDTDDQSSHDGNVFGQSQHGDKHDADDDHIPPPQPTGPELMTFLGAHLHFGDHLV